MVRGRRPPGPLTADERTGDPALGAGEGFPAYRRAGACAYHRRMCSPDHVYPAPGFPPPPGLDSGCDHGRTDFAAFRAARARYLEGLHRQADIARLESAFALDTSDDPERGV